MTGMCVLAWCLCDFSVRDETVGDFEVMVEFEEVGDFESVERALDGLLGGLDRVGDKITVADRGDTAFIVVRVDLHGIGV
jgi:hypothetical protein